MIGHGGDLGSPRRMYKARRVENMVGTACAGGAYSLERTIINFGQQQRGRCSGARSGLGYMIDIEEWKVGAATTSSRAVI